MLLPLKSTSNRGWRFFPARKSGRSWVIVVVASLLASLLLAACGEEATPAPVAPTATPAPRYQQENNPALQFSMNIPFGWNKTPVDANTIVYTKPDNPSIGIGVVS